MTYIDDEGRQRPGPFPPEQIEPLPWLPSPTLATIVPFPSERVRASDPEAHPPCQRCAEQCAASHHWLCSACWWDEHQRTRLRRPRGL